MPTAVPTPPLGPPASAPPLTAGPSPRAAAPDSALLRVYFSNPFPQGHLIVRVGALQVFNRLLDAKKNEVPPPIDEMVPVSAGDQQLQVWAVSTDRTVNFYQAYPVSCLAGEIRTLELELQPAGLSVALR